MDEPQRNTELLIQKENYPISIPSPIVFLSHSTFINRNEGANVPVVTGFVCLPNIIHELLQQTGEQTDLF